VETPVNHSLQIDSQAECVRAAIGGRGNTPAENPLRTQRVEHIPKR
jgi:hypothetical protein